MKKYQELEKVLKKLYDYIYFPEKGVTLNDLKFDSNNIKMHFQWWQNSDYDSITISSYAQPIFQYFMNKEEVYFDYRIISNTTSRLQNLIKDYIMPEYFTERKIEVFEVKKYQ